MDVAAMAEILAGVSGSHDPEPSVPVLVVQQLLQVAKGIDWKFLTGVDPELRIVAIKSELTMHLCNDPSVSEERRGLVSCYRLYSLQETAKLKGVKEHAARMATKRGQLRTFDDPDWLRFVSSQAEGKIFPTKKPRKDSLLFHGLEVKRWCLGVSKDDTAGLNIIACLPDIQSLEAVEQRKELEAKMAPGQSQFASLYSKRDRKKAVLVSAEEFQNVAGKIILEKATAGKKEKSAL